jgi:hypothetical protein
VYFIAVAGPRSRFTQRGLYPNPPSGPTGVSTTPTGPRVIFTFAKGPFSMQPPPNPGGI